MLAEVKFANLRTNNFYFLSFFLFEDIYFLFLFLFVSYL